MIKRVYGYLMLHKGPVPEATRTLHERGFVAIRGALDAETVAELRTDVERVFDEDPADQRLSTRDAEGAASFRYAMLNRSAAAQQALANPRILEVIEPLLGDDCHVIANTAWRNAAGRPGSHGGDNWHIDAGPHVPRASGVKWPAEIPYPTFAIASHILLRDLELADGPTGFIPGSQRSGRIPPFDALKDPELSWEGEQCVPVLGAAGDVVLFISDIWHRRMPTLAADAGRLFVQVHYARRDIAQRLYETSESNQLSAEAIARAQTPRERTLVGLHDPMFYDG